MMKKERSPEFKKRVALEALKEQKSVREIAAEYEIHPMQVCKWKKQLYDKAALAFESSAKKSAEQVAEVREAKLHEKIGQLTIELDWMKKKVGIG